MNPNSHRYGGGFPKIGIRPIVDRRKLVKAALAESTMNLAREAAAEITAVLRNPDGSPVEVVIFESCISGMTEAARCAEQFRKEGVGVLVSVSSGWCYPLETMETDPMLPHAVWGFNGTERPGAVYLAALHAAHNQKGLPIFKIYGRHIQDQHEGKLPQDVRDQLIRFTRAGMAAALLRGKSYLSIGSVSMGIAYCIVDENFYQRYLGMRNAYVDMTEVRRRMENTSTMSRNFKRRWLGQRSSARKARTLILNPFRSARRAN